MSAISFKTLTQDDITTSRTLLHEAIPITGTLISGTYNTTLHSDSISREANIKTFSHGMFQTIYDYPYASSSANHIFDITAGVSPSETWYANVVTQKNKKANIYNQMAQILSGYDTNGNIQPFDRDGDHSGSLGKFTNAAFLSFSRLLVKDEIKKGSFEMKLGESESYNSPFGSVMTISDAAAAENYRANSPAGEYGFLKTDGYDEPLGIVYYQAGVVVLDVEEALSQGSTAHLLASGSSMNSVIVDEPDTEPRDVFKSGTIDQMADALRHRIQNIKFNNTT